MKFQEYNSLSPDLSLVMLGGRWSPKHLSKRGHPRLREPDCLPQTRHLTSSIPYERPWAPGDWRSQKIISSDLLFLGIQREQPTESQKPQPRGKFEVPGSAIAFWATALCRCTLRPGPDSTNRWEAGFTYCILTSRLEGATRQLLSWEHFSSHNRPI